MMQVLQNNNLMYFNFAFKDIPCLVMNAYLKFNIIVV